MTATAQVELPLEAEEFLTWLAVERGRSVNTLDAYRSDLRFYWSFVQEERGRATLAAVEPDDIVAYLGHRQQLGHARSSVNRGAVAIRGLHVGLVMFLVVRLPLPFPRPLCTIFRLFLLILFTVLTGANPPVLRAALTFSLHLLVTGSGRCSSRATRKRRSPPPGA